MITIPPVSMLDWLIFLMMSGISLLILIKVLKFIWRGPLQPPYKQKALFSPPATHALRLIDEAIKNQLRVFSSVSLAEFLTVNPALSKSKRDQAWQHLYGETVDFILCSPHDLKVRVAIVLSDDRASKKEQRKQQKLWQLLQATGLPLIEVSPKAWPSASTLRAEILTACKAASSANAPISNKPSFSRVEPVMSLLDDDAELAQNENEPAMKVSAND